MLFVDQPESFQRLMPGFLPETLGGPGGERPLPRGAKNLLASLWGSSTGLFSSPGSPASLGGGFWDWWFLASTSATSQYDLLRRAIDAEEGLPGQVVCLALEGSGFHGQADRPWAARPGNLHLTVGLRGDLEASTCGMALTMLPVVAVADALSGLGDDHHRLPEVGIKWVNDLVIQGRKAGGVLTSARSQNGRVRSVVLGIGLNVAAKPAVEPTVFTPSVTCLADHLDLGEQGLTSVLVAVLQNLAYRFEELGTGGPGPLLAAYRRSSVILGRQVEVRHDHHPVRRGRVLDIGPDLALALSDDPRPVTAGRLILLPELPGQQDSPPRAE